MTFVTVPIIPEPNQSVAFMLNGNSYFADINLRGSGLYITLKVNNETVLSSRALLSYAPIGYGLQLADTLGVEDPVYTGLGDRWILVGLQNE